MPTVGSRFACVIFVAGVVGCSSPSRAPTDASDEITVDAEIADGEFGAACSKLDPAPFTVTEDTGPIKARLPGFCGAATGPMEW